MKTPTHLDGQWSSNGSRPIPGVLESRGNRFALRLNGTFQGFESFEPGGRGAPSARNVIYGRTADGRLVTLVDCVVSSATSYPGRLRRERTTYSVGWYVDGAKFRSYDQILLREIRFSCDYLTELVGETFISPAYSNRERSVSIAYEEPPEVICALGGFNIRIRQRLPWVLWAAHFRAVEQAELTITSKDPVPFDVFWEGPVATLLSLFIFIADLKLRLSWVTGRQTLRTPRHLSLIGFSARRTPKPLRDHAVRQFLFTVRSLTPERWQQVLSAWESLRATFRPVWALVLDCNNRFLAIQRTTVLDFGSSAGDVPSRKAQWDANTGA